MGPTVSLGGGYCLTGVSCLPVCFLEDLSQAPRSWQTPLLNEHSFSFSCLAAWGRQRGEDPQNLTTDRLEKVGTDQLVFPMQKPPAQGHRAVMLLDMNVLWACFGYLGAPHILPFPLPYLQFHHLHPHNRHLCYLHLHHIC